MKLKTNKAKEDTYRAQLETNKGNPTNTHCKGKMRKAKEYTYTL